MASDTVTKKFSAHRFPIIGSRLGRLVLFLNLGAFLILIIGLLVVAEFKQGLIEARKEALLSEGRLFADVVADFASRAEPYPELEQGGLYVLQRFIPNGQRARIFTVQQKLLVDSAAVSDAVTETPLPPARTADAAEPKGQSAAEQTQRAKLAHAALSAEVAKAVALGGPVADVRPTIDGGRVVSVSVPLRHAAIILGVLTLESGDVEKIVAAQRMAMLPFALIALMVTVFTAFALDRLVTGPILRLSAAADRVRLSQARSIVLPDVERRPDEIGDLARALESMTEALSDRIDAIERFAADVSHEIKNPLTSIRSAVETLALVTDESAKARLSKVLMHDVRRLDRLITDISNASRLDAELSRDRPHPVDLSRLLSEITELYQQTAQPDEPRVSIALDPGLEHQVWVQGRESALGQVFRNLIDNARSFSAPGGEVRVSLVSADGGGPGRYHVRVDDDGPGIPPENLETVFERFYTSRPKGAAFGGHSGLGLAIVRQIVETHNGRVWAENRLGADGGVVGARFIVSF